MKLLMAVAALAMSITGCSSSCKDGTNWEAGWAGGYQYAECHRGCCDKDNPKKCKCSDRCGCHKEVQSKIIVTQPQ